MYVIHYTAKSEPTDIDGELVNLFQSSDDLATEVDGRNCSSGHRAPSCFPARRCSQMSGCCHLYILVGYFSRRARRR